MESFAKILLMIEMIGPFRGLVGAVIGAIIVGGAFQLAPQVRYLLPGWSNAALYLECAMSPLPTSTPAGSALKIYSPSPMGDAGLAEMTIQQGSPISWPADYTDNWALANLGCRLINYDKEPVVNVRLPIRMTPADDAGKIDPKQGQVSSIDIPKIEAGASYSFYVLNQGPRAVGVLFGQAPTYQKVSGERLDAAFSEAKGPIAGSFVLYSFRPAP